MTSWGMGWEFDMPDELLPSLREAAKEHFEKCDEPDENFRGMSIVTESPSYSGKLYCPFCGEVIVDAQH